MTVLVRPVTIEAPHWSVPRRGRIVAARLLVLYEDDATAVWYDSEDLPGVTVTITEEA